MDKTSKINYYKLMDVIKDGILRHNKQLFLGELLLKNSITEYQLNNEEFISERIRQHIDGMAYNVLSEIEEKFPQIKIVVEEED